MNHLLRRVFSKKSFTSIVITFFASLGVLNIVRDVSEKITSISADIARQPLDPLTLDRESRILSVKIIQVDNEVENRVFYKGRMSENKFTLNASFEIPFEVLWLRSVIEVAGREDCDILVGEKPNPPFSESKLCIRLKILVEL